MHVVRVDHLVLTVADIATTVAWYTKTLGMRHVTFAAGRQALAFGQQKLNLHEAGSELEPRAARPQPGSTDLCLVSEADPDEVLRHLRECGVPVEEGPVSRTGATGPITSVYVRDPDRNLIEIATYDGVTEHGRAAAQHTAAGQAQPERSKPLPSNGNPCP